MYKPLKNLIILHCTIVTHEVSVCGSNLHSIEYFTLHLANSCYPNTAKSKLSSCPFETLRGRFNTQQRKKNSLFIRANLLHVQWNIYPPGSFWWGTLLEGYSVPLILAYIINEGGCSLWKADCFNSTATQCCFSTDKGEEWGRKKINEEEKTSRRISPLCLSRTCCVANERRFGRMLNIEQKLFGILRHWNEMNIINKCQLHPQSISCVCTQCVWCPTIYIFLTFF